MKNLLAILVLASSTCFATEKICFGAKNNPDTKGDQAVAQITMASVVFTGNSEYAAPGTYPKTKEANVQGKDGKTYLTYDYGGSDGCDTILVDEALLQEGTKGLLKLRCRGEGFFEYNYLCRDQK